MNQRPNIVYILADDMGYGDVSALNENAAFKTPNFDSIAASGVSFTDAHASSAVCTPSRYSIMTGRYNWRSRLKWGVISGFDEPIIEPGRKTVAEMLKEQGYKTSVIGKWHLGMSFKKADSFEMTPAFEQCEGVDYSAKIENSPVTMGFDYYYGISGSLDMPPFVYIENDHFTQLPDHETVNEGKGFWRKGPTAPDFEHEQVLPLLTEKVIERITEYSQEQDPFFIYFPMPAPHTPILPTEEFRGKSGTNEYGDFVLECDAMVGKIIKKLKDLDIYNNTILIFTSDNGCSPRADYKELLACGHNPSYIFRGHKFHIYEGGHRVPLLITWPDKIAPNSSCNKIVCLGDFMATIAEILGYEMPDDMGEDSVSNLPMWLDSDSPGTRNDIVHQSWDGSLSIRKGNYKLEMCCDSGGETHPGPRGTYMFPIGISPEKEQQTVKPIKSKFQLYELESDVSETRNVIDEHPSIAEYLKRILSSHIRNGRSTPGSMQKNTGEDIWEAIGWLKD